MNRFSNGYHGQRYCSWARTRDDDDDGGVAQDGGHVLTRNAPAVGSGSMPSLLCGIFKENKQTVYRF